MFTTLNNIHDFENFHEFETACYFKQCLEILQNHKLKVVHLFEDFHGKKFVYNLYNV